MNNSVLVFCPMSNYITFLNSEMTPKQSRKKEEKVSRKMTITYMPKEELALKINHTKIPKFLQKAIIRVSVLTYTYDD